MARRSRARLVVALVGVLLAGIAAAFGLGAFSHGLSPQQRAALQEAAERAAVQRLLASERVDISHAARSLASPLPTKFGAPAPAPAPGAALFRTPIPRHEVLGFVPYWDLASLPSVDYSDATILSFFALDFDPSGNGSLTSSGPAWDALTSSGFSDFLASAHAARDRVLLTVSTTSTSLIDQLVSTPSTSSARLAGQLDHLVTQFGFDGVDIDIEGRGMADRAPFVRFMSNLSQLLRTADPHGEIVLDTYPQSASSSYDFFDVRALAPLVDELFVMAYDMYDPTEASANSPIYSPILGFSIVQTLLDYAKVVPAKKTILGLPFYGLDFTTLSARAPAPSDDSSPTAVTYASIVAVGRSAKWDPASASLFTSFKRGALYHETWYDDPTSLALKVALAAVFHLAGVGAFAFGQEGDAPAMPGALDGGAKPIKLAAAPGGA